jgi:hypothetical protein
MGNTPTAKRIPIHRRIKNHAISHNISPNTPSEVATEENMISVLLTSMAEKTEARTFISPQVHLLLGDESIPKNQPKNKSMLRNSQCKPNKLMPLYHMKLDP